MDGVGRGLMAIVYFAVINFVDFIQKAPKKNDDIRQFPPLFSPNIIQWVSELK